MKDKKFSEKVVGYCFLIIITVILGQIIVPNYNHYKKNHTAAIAAFNADSAEIPEWKLIENHFRAQRENDKIVSLKKFKISKNGSLMKDLKISRDEAFQIAKTDSLLIGIDSATYEQYPIVHEKDVFVHYVLQSGETGWYKDKPEYSCLMFEDALDK